MWMKKNTCILFISKLKYKEKKNVEKETHLRIMIGITSLYINWRDNWLLYCVESSNP